MSQQAVRPRERTMTDTGPIGGWAIPRLRTDDMAIDQPVAPHPRWGHPLIRIVVFLAVAGVIGGLGLGLAYLVDPSGPGDGPGMLVTALGLIVAALAAYLVMTGVLERRWPVELDPRRASGLLGGLALGTTLLLVSGGIAWAMGGLVVEGRRPVGDTPWLTDVIMTGFFAAVVEEILFRGIVFRFLEHWVGSWIAVGASAVIFGSVHILADDATRVSTAATIVEAGLLFAMVYVRRGRCGGSSACTPRGTPCSAMSSGSRSPAMTTPGCSSPTPPART